MKTTTLMYVILCFASCDRPTNHPTLSDDEITRLFTKYDDTVIPPPQDFFPHITFPKTPDTEWWHSERISPEKSGIPSKVRRRSLLGRMLSSNPGANPNAPFFRETYPNTDKYFLITIDPNGL